MRISKTESIPLPPAQLKRAERLAKRKTVPSVGWCAKPSASTNKSGNHVPSTMIYMLPCGLQQWAKAAGLDKTREAEISKHD